MLYLLSYYYMKREILNSSFCYKKYAECYIFCIVTVKVLNSYDYIPSGIPVRFL